MMNRKKNVDGSDVLPSSSGGSDSVNGVKEQTDKRALVVVFVSLVLDLLAFTVILPLLPSLLDYYGRHDDEVFSCATTAPWSPLHLGRHCTLGAAAPWSPLHLGHHCTLVTTAPWAPLHLDHHCTLVTTAPCAPLHLGHHCTLVTTAPWSPMHLVRHFTHGAAP